MSYLDASVKEVEHMQMDLICKNGCYMWSFKKKKIMKTTEPDKNCFYTKYNVYNYLLDGHIFDKIW